MPSRGVTNQTPIGSISNSTNEQLYAIRSEIHTTISMLRRLASSMEMHASTLESKARTIIAAVELTYREVERSNFTPNRLLSSISALEAEVYSTASSIADIENMYTGSHDIHERVTTISGYIETLKIGVSGTLPLNHNGPRNEPQSAAFDGERNQQSAVRTPAPVSPTIPSPDTPPSTTDQPLHADPTTTIHHPPSLQGAPVHHRLHQPKLKSFETPPVAFVVYGPHPNFTIGGPSTLYAHADIKDEYYNMVQLADDFTSTVFNGDCITSTVAMKNEFFSVGFSTYRSASGFAEAVSRHPPVKYATATVVT